MLGMVTSLTSNTDAIQTPVTRIDQVSSSSADFAERQMAPLPAKRLRTQNVRLADFHYEGPSARSGNKGLNLLCLLWRVLQM